MNHPLKKGPALPKDEGLAFPRHAVPGKAKSESRYPAPARRARPPAESKSELAKILRDCTREFSRRIIARDTVQGRVKCISCPTVMHAGEAEPGHYLRRGYWMARFHPHNVNGQCHRCNCELSGNPEGYRKGIAERYGADALEAVHALKRLGGKLRLIDARELLVSIMAGKVV